MADATNHTVIYHGVLLHGGFEPVSATGWASILDADAEDLEHQLIMHSIHQLSLERPDMVPERIRMVEFSWTDLGPLEIPEVPRFVDLIKHDKEEDPT